MKLKMKDKKTLKKKKSPWRAQSELQKFLATLM